MSLYRLVPANNLTRMVVAVLLAITLHMGLMNFEFTPVPLFVPEVSLPRSVSVFLGQKNMVEEPENQTLNEQIESESQVPLENSAVPENEENITPLPELSTKKEKQKVQVVEEKRESEIEKILAAEHGTENIREISKAELSTEIHKPGAPLKSVNKTVQKEKGVSLPGTLQTAYPRYNLNVPPPYPRLARKRGQEGTVVLQVLVNRQGRVDDLKIEVSSNFSMLDRAAVKAVQKWSFEPGMQGKERIAMWVKVPVTFKLNK